MSNGNKIKAAIITENGKPPVYGDFKSPKPLEGFARITVSASALSHIAKSRASGTHYTSGSDLPFVVGLDGTGVREDGRRVYFVLPESPFGGMAEQTIVREEHCIELPDDLDDITAAAMAIPGMSSWAALRERAKLVTGETVLINGATGTSGRLAVQIAKHLGAKKVIATGRNTAALASLSVLGADVVIPLTPDKSAFEIACKKQFSEGVDVVLDYLWGETAEMAMINAAKAGLEGRPIRYVQVGAASAPTITLPGAVLRASALILMGSGFNSVPLPRLLNAIAELFCAAVPEGFAVAAKVVPLSQVEDHWSNLESTTRTVFTPKA